MDIKSEKRLQEIQKVLNHNKIDKVEELDKVVRKLEKVKSQEKNDWSKNEKVKLGVKFKSGVRKKEEDVVEEDMTPNQKVEKDENVAKK